MIFIIINPSISQFSLGGQLFDELRVRYKFQPRADGTRGVRNNKGFESLTITPDNRFLYSATENTLVQVYLRIYL